MDTPRHLRCQRCSYSSGVKRAGLMQGSVLCRDCAGDIQSLLDKWQKNQFRIRKATDLSDVNEKLRQQFTEDELVELDDYTRISVFGRDEDPRNG